MSRSDRGTTIRFVAVVVVFAVAAAGVVGVAGGQSAESYSLTQDGQCTPITPLSGDEPVLAFYAYQSPYGDNPYTTELGESYSSEGTADLQENETSMLFLYRDAFGVLSLVMVHGTRGEGTDGGAASFDVSGLPAGGEWAVKDDEYNNTHNYDQWNHTERTAEIDWTWSGNATDGGAYAGLGDDFAVSIDPAFNEEAALYGQHYDGSVEEWHVLSGDRTDPDRIALGLDEPVTISSEPCDDSVAPTDDGTDGDRGTGADESGVGTETTEEATLTTESPTTTTEPATVTPERGTETTEAGTETTEDETETTEGEDGGADDDAPTAGPNSDGGDGGGTDATDGQDDDGTPEEQNGDEAGESGGNGGDAPGGPDDSNGQDGEDDQVNEE